jgi:hypothetical protein
MNLDIISRFSSILNPGSPGQTLKSPNPQFLSCTRPTALRYAVPSGLGEGTPLGAKG